MTKDQRTGHIAMFSASVMWGAMAPISKFVMDGGLVDAVTVTDVRIFGAALLFWLVSPFMKREKVERKDFLKIFGAAMFAIVLNQGVYISGVSMTSPVDASIITTSLPIVTMLLAAVILKEPITSRKAIGVLLGACGALLLAFGNRLMPGFHASDSSSASSNVWGGSPLLFRPMLIRHVSGDFQRYNCQVFSCHPDEMDVYLRLGGHASPVIRQVLFGALGSCACRTVRRTRVHSFLRHIPVLLSGAAGAEDPASDSCGNVQLSAACSCSFYSSHLGNGLVQYNKGCGSHPCFFRSADGKQEQVKGGFGKSHEKSIRRFRCRSIFRRDVMIPKNISEEMRKKIVGKGIDPAFMDKHRAALVRRHRQVIYLNDRELEAIDRYCGQYGVSSKSVLFREAVMEKVLSCLSDSHPTLF